MPEQSECVPVEVLDYNMVDTRYKPATKRNKARVVFKSPSLTIYWNKNFRRSAWHLTDADNHV